MSLFSFAKQKLSMIFQNKICFSYVFYKRKACVYCVVCALFSCISLVRLMLRNCSENKFFLKIVVLFIITIFGVDLQVYLQNLLIHDV